MKKTIAIIMLFFCFSRVFAAERLVPGQYPTIQAAIDASQNGDIVTVAPGRYFENVDFDGKAIIVRSSQPGDWETVRNTTIDGNSNGSCVVFDNGEGSDSILEGFTLTNGNGSMAWFECRDDTTGPSPMIHAGGGILCLHSSPSIRRCNIVGNGFAYCTGGGIAVLGDCQAMISSCFIINNQGGANFGGGGGILIRGNNPETATSTIENCTIVSNVTETYDSYERYQVDCWDTRPTIRNTIIWPDPRATNENASNYNRSLLISYPSMVSYCCLKDSYCLPPRVGDDELRYRDAEPCDLTVAGGNIDEGAFFAQPLELPGEDFDHHLLAGSSCIDAGGSPNTETDIDGQPRVMGLRSDIGADEVTPEIVVTRPAAGDVWVSGSIHEIQWVGYGADALDILLSTDAGGSWQTIESAVADTGTYTWQLPGSADSNQCLVNVVPSAPDANVITIESGLFSIVPFKDRPHLPQGRQRPQKKFGPELLNCVKWQFETDGPVTASVTIARNSRVYIPCEDGKLYVLNTDDGTLRWSYDVNTPLASAAAVGTDGTVYVGDENGRLYAIDKKGKLLWTHTTDGPIYSSPVISPEGEVYICSLDGKLHALDRDGTELWTFETDGFGAIGGSVFAAPRIAPDGTIYIAGLYDPNLYALDPADGSVKWNCNFEFPADPCDPNSDTKTGWPFASPAVAKDGTIYQTLMYDSNLYAIEPQSGTIIRATDLSDPCSGFFEPNYLPGDTYRFPYWYLKKSAWTSEPALAPDGTVYVSFEDPYLRAVDPNGSLKWATRLGTDGGFTLAVADDGLIYAACDDNLLYLVSPEGQELAQFEGSGWLSFPVLAPGHTLIVSDANDTVWAIGDGDCDKPQGILHRRRNNTASGRPEETGLIIRRLEKK